MLRTWTSQKIIPHNSTYFHTFKPLQMFNDVVMMSVALTRLYCRREETGDQHPRSVERKREPDQNIRGSKQSEICQACQSVIYTVSLLWLIRLTFMTKLDIILENSNIIDDNWCFPQQSSWINWKDYNAGWRE